MVTRWCSPASGALLLAFSLTSCLTTSVGALTEYGRADEDTTLPVTTSLQGTIQGVNMVTRLNRTFYGFMGIPYAQPPVGDLRFAPPVAAGAWNGTFNASSECNACPQSSLMSGTVSGDEDCLYLHVYTPQLPTSTNSTLLPVIVFIFGGGFTSGNPNPTSYGPYSLLDKDVLYVSPNFRLGVLGYLNTGDAAAPGNLGLKDIVLALQWIQDNIQYFGGDPNRVTLFGQSAGSMSVSALALADRAKGLFHRLITNSGTALSLELAPALDVYVNRTYILAEYLGCSTTTSAVLVNCLRGFNTSELLTAYSSNPVFQELQHYPRGLWFPSQEADIEGALFTDSFANLFAAGKHHDIPWLALHDQTEEKSGENFASNATQYQEFLDNIDALIPYLAGYLPSHEKAAIYTPALKAYYFNDLTADQAVVAGNISLMTSDAKFYYPTYHMLQQQLELGTSPLFFTLFAYLGSSPTSTETGHGSELKYIISNANQVAAFDATDHEFVDIIVQLYTSFAANGKPTLEGANANVWEQYSTLNNYLRLGNGTGTAVEMEYDLYVGRMEYWKTFITSGVSRIQLQLLPIFLCLSFLSALYQR